ncbi:50S ribosomal protein L25 [Patescibacteria group bacterium]|nr:50S ribosomal protein L25 [Patescibacteria group bacterium]
MLELQAQPRNILGKQTSRLRKEGVIPAVVYGEGVAAESLSVKAFDFEKVYREAGESALVTLKVGNTPRSVLVHDVQYEPLRGKPIHIDFYAVRMDQKIEIKVPLRFVGESPAVRDEGGTLVKIMHEIEIEVLPKDLPHELEVDMSLLKSFDDKISVADIKLPQGVAVKADAGETVAVVEAPRSEAELAELEAESKEAPAVAEVKTEQEMKREEKAKEEVAGEKKEA